MAWTCSWFLHCDGCGDCVESCFGKKAAKQVAKEEGWEILKSSAYCPDCRNLRSKDNNQQGDSDASR